MELLEFKQKTKELFKYNDFTEINKILLENANNEEFIEGYLNIIQNDFSKDWLQSLYQYELSDREQKHQDYTPICLSKLVSKLVGESDVLIDMCAGSGSLGIQCFNQYADKNEYIFLEADENVIGFLIFNLVIRNIKSKVKLYDVITEEIKKVYIIKKGEKYGSVISE